SQQLRVDGVVDAVVGNTLAGNPTVWDEVVDGDLVATGIIKAGGSLWIDGVTPNNHRIAANDDLNLGTTNANDVRLSTNGTTAVSIDGTTQQVNVQSSLNLAGANVPLLLNGTTGGAGEALLSGGVGTTPSWGRVSASGLNLSQNAMFVGDATNRASELPSAPNRFMTTDASGVPGWRSTLPAGVTIGFDQITSGTNIVATMNVGTGASLQPTGSGTVTANQVVGTGSTTAAVDLATGEVAGTLPINRGGTNGTATPTAGAVAYGTGTAYGFSAAGTSGNVLVSGGVGAPVWQNPNGLFWGLTGNSGINPATNFLGTTDAQPLIFRTDNVERMRIAQDGRIGIGVTIPSQTIDVSANNGAGVMRIVNAASSPALLLSSSGFSNTLTIGSNAFIARSDGSVFMNGTQLIFDFQGNSNNSRFTLRNADVAGVQAFFSVQDSGLVVTRDRRVGIGVPVPLAKLHVVSPALDPLRIEGLATNNAASNVLVSNGGGIVYTRTASNLIDSTAWSLTGNAGTNATTNFLGTRDNVSLNFRVNNQRAFRIEPTASDPNIIAGPTTNTVTSAAGAVIGGGSTNSITANYAVVTGGQNNTASGLNAVIAGGRQNSATGGLAVVGGGRLNNATDTNTTIAGGLQNLASADFASIGGGRSNQATADFARVGGGNVNTVQATYATIAGGELNNVVGSWGFIGGGHRNYVGAPYSMVGGGRNNQDSSQYTFIGGGDGNIITTGATYGTIGGGQINTVQGLNGTISGGLSNMVSATGGTVGGGEINRAMAANSTVAGGRANFSYSTGGFIGSGRRNVDSSAEYSVIAGGDSDTIYANASWATIGGGQTNRVQGGGIYATIAGGNSNTAAARSTTIAGGEGNIVSANYATVAGGFRDSALAIGATVSGGSNNTAGGSGATVGGGSRNKATGASSTIAGGVDNVASVGSSTVAGGVRNTAAGGNSVVGGGGDNTVNAGNATIAGGSNNTVSADQATISGGTGNTATGTWSVVAGGQSNSTLGSFSVVSGGDQNRASSIYGVVAGGFTNLDSAQYGTISGGRTNIIRPTGTNGVISGGLNNILSGLSSVIVGGENNLVTGTRSSVLGGRNDTVTGSLSTVVGGMDFRLDGSRSFGFHSNNVSGTRPMSIAASDVAVFGNSDLWLANNDSNASQLRFYEPYNLPGAFPGTANYTAFRARPQSADITYLLPDTAGIVGDQLTVSSVSGTNVTLDWGRLHVSDSAWSLAGNVGTNPATNFLGTRDVQPLVLRTNNTERMRVTETGDVGIGTSVITTGARLNVVGGDIIAEQLPGRRIGFGAGKHGIIHQTHTGGANTLYVASLANLHFVADANNSIADIGSNIGDNTFVWGLNNTHADSAAYVELARLNAVGFLGFDVNGGAPPTRIYAKNNNRSEEHDDIMLQTFSDTYTPSTVMQRALGTESTPGNLVAGDVVGTHVFSPYLTGGSFTPGAAIRAVADLNHSATNVDTRLEFMTTNTTTLATAMTIDRLGQVGIGTTTPAQALHVVGNAGKTVGGTTWVVISDERTKNVEGEYEKGLDEILALRPVTFKYKEDNPWNAPSDILQYGFIAQEVQPIFPEAIEEQSDGYLTFNMHPLLVAYTNAIKGLNEKVEDLQSENAELKAELETVQTETTTSLDELRSRIEQLEALLSGTSKTISKNQESVK
ncbi:MAG: tail fiber domain-containing protein, partial [Candidatus Kapaibacterium sp.]